MADTPLPPGMTREELHECNETACEALTLVLRECAARLGLPQSELADLVRGRAVLLGMPAAADLLATYVEVLSGRGL